MLRLLLVILVNSHCFAKDVDVLFVPPGKLRHWKDVTMPMIPAAKTLNLNLTIHSVGNTDKENYENQVLELISATNNVDWLIWSQLRIATQKILEALKARNIKSIDITSGLFNYVQEKIGYPQQQYKNWMAQVVTDEYEGGQRLVRELIALRRTSPAENIRVVALAGNKRVASTVVNVSGLHQGGADDADEVLQVVHISWKRDVARRMTEQLLNRYKIFDVIWAGNTSIALGAADLLKEMTIPNSARPMVANLGWSKDTFAAIKKV